MGVILPGGTDWQTLADDGTIGIEARYLIELTDGTRVELQSRGPAPGRCAGLLVQHLAAYHQSGA